MSYEVETLPIFDQQTKRLAKKYPSLKYDLKALFERLAIDPQQGVPLGRGFYKIRWAISSKNRGKSGGARMITYVKVVEEKVYLTNIFDKSEKETLTDAELNVLFDYLQRL